MAIVLDELARAKELLKTKKFGSYIKLKDLILLSKYYYYTGMETRQIKKELRSQCKQVDKNWNDAVQGWKINVAIRESHKRRLRIPTPIPITKAELSRIKEINNYVLEKVLFIFLAMSKILKYNTVIIKPRRKPVLVGLFYLNEKANNIFALARVDVRKKQRNEMLHDLFLKGYIDSTRYGGFTLKYVFEDSPTEFLIEDYESLVLYYQRYCGEQVVGCSCGRLFLKRGNRSNSCHQCRQERRRERWREEQKRHREKKSNVSV